MNAITIAIDNKDDRNFPYHFWPAKQHGYIHSAVVEAIADITATILHEDNNKIGANASYDKLRAIFHYT